MDDIRPFGPDELGSETLDEKQVRRIAVLFINTILQVNQDGPKQVMEAVLLSLFSGNQSAVDSLIAEYRKLWTVYRLGGPALDSYDNGPVIYSFRVKT